MYSGGASAMNQQANLPNAPQECHWLLCVYVSIYQETVSGHTQDLTRIYMYFWLFCVHFGISYEPAG